MEISAEKSKLMTNSANDIQREIKVKGQKLGTVTSFKYLGAVVSDNGSKPEVLSRIAQYNMATHINGQLLTFYIAFQYNMATHINGQLLTFYIAFQYNMATHNHMDSHIVLECNVKCKKLSILS